MMRDDQFDRLYSAHSQALFGFLAYRTGDRALAEDLLADTFERALRARRRFDRRKGSEKAWLYAIALNCLRDHGRRTVAQGRALERAGTAAQTGNPDPALESVEQHDELSRALGALSDEERETIALRYGADLTVPEIAKVTKNRLTTAEGRLYRALKKLREELD
jgi:RNA polymerase sigma-70 factor (ECF subfamily)